MVKIAANLSGIHDLKSVGSTGIKSIPPSAKSAFLDLYMCQNKRERIEKENIRLQKRGGQINQNLSAINERMAKLLKTATTGNERLERIGEKACSESGNHTVLEY